MKKLLFILFTLVSLSMMAAETIVVGEVYDAASGQPLPAVNIYWQGSHEGTSTNEEGLFMLRSEQTRKRILVFSCVGYRKQRFEIEPGSSVGVDVAMEEVNHSLEEVFVVPGVNPALAIMDSIRAHRKDNDLSAEEKAMMSDHDFSDDRNIYVSHIRSKLLRRHIFQSLQQHAVQQADSTYLLLLYSTQREENMLTETDLPSLLHHLDGTPNFYENPVYYLGTSFVSPLSNQGNTFYQYYLKDSLDSAEGKTYVIDFRTKNGFYATFNGTLTVDSGSWALRTIDASVPSEVNLKYLTDLTIHQQFAVSGSMQDENVSILLDWAVKQDTSHVFPSLLLTRHRERLVSDQRLPKTQSQPIISESSAMDSISPLIRTARFFAHIINTGYIPTHYPIEIGNIEEIFQVNRHEMIHVGLPIRTSEKLWKNVSLEAHVGYGFRDQAFKGMGQVSINLPTQRRHIMQLRYWDHYVYSEVSDFDRLMRENSIGYGNMDFTSYAFEAIRYNNQSARNSAARHRELRLSTEDDWHENIETQFALRVGRMGYGDPMEGYHQMKSFPYAALSGVLRVGFDERKVDFYFRRLHLYSRYPTLYFGLEMGSYKTDFVSTYQMYGKLQLMIRQNVPLGPAGSLHYTLTGGVILGAVPYSFLEIFDGNQGYAYDPYRFTLMNNNQYAADRYLALHAEWNGRGVLFNLIPGIRYLRLNELVTFKLAYGGLSERHQRVLPFATNSMCQSLSTPYVELGVGIGNILRVMDIHSVWRLTNRQDPTTPLWAMRFRINMGI